MGTRLGQADHREVLVDTCPCKKGSFVGFQRTDVKGRTLVAGVPLSLKWTHRRSSKLAPSVHSLLGATVRCPAGWLLPPEVSQVTSSGLSRFGCCVAGNKLDTSQSIRRLRLRAQLVGAVSWLEEFRSGPTAQCKDMELDTVFSGVNRVSPARLCLVLRFNSCGQQSVEEIESAGWGVKNLSRCASLFFQRYMRRLRHLIGRNAGQ